MLRRVAVPTLFAAFLLCGAGAPPEGTSVDLAAGASAYEIRRGGCGAPLYRYDIVEPAVHAAVHHRGPRGWTVSGAATVAPGVVTRSNLEQAGDAPSDPEDVYAVGEVIPSADVALTGGWHGTWAGIEGGAGFVLLEGTPFLLPVGTVWIGQPRIFYAWLDAFTGPFTGYLAHDMAAGLGTRQAGWRARLGASPTGLVAALAAPLPGEPAWELGVEAQFNPLDEALDRPATRTLLTARWRPGE